MFISIASRDNVKQYHFLNACPQVPFCRRYYLPGYLHSLKNRSENFFGFENSLLISKKWAIISNVAAHFS